MMTTLVNSIKIPYHFVELCEQWHGSIHCLMYAVSSTGNLTTGSIRSRGCETDQEHYLDIWRSLAVDVTHTKQAAEEVYHEDSFSLSEFEEYADNIVEKLEKEYNLTGWEPEL